MTKATIPVWNIKGNDIPLSHLSTPQLELALKICYRKPDKFFQTGIEVRRALKTKKLIDNIFKNNIAFIENKINIY